MIGHKMYTIVELVDEAFGFAQPYNHLHNSVVAQEALDFPLLELAKAGLEEILEEGGSF